MSRIVLTPTPTGDGRVVLRAEVLTTAERLRRALARFRASLGR